MGPAKASELILFNKKISAAEAKDAGLISEVFPNHEFQHRAWARIEKYAALPPKSLKYSKGNYSNKNRIKGLASNLTKF